MPNQLKTLDSVGGFSIDKTVLVNETKDIKNVNSLEVKNSFFDDNENDENDFEFNQDFEIGEENNNRSPGWARYLKRIK